MGHVENANHRNVIRFTKGIHIRIQKAGECPALEKIFAHANTKMARMRSRTTISRMPNLRPIMKSSRY
jgi:hypothetical protein